MSILPPMSFSSGALKANFLNLCTGILIVLIVVCFVRRRFQNRIPGAFQNGHGEAIQCLPQDTRFSRFTHGHELSQEGLEKFPNNPFLVRNGSKKELVIFNAEQVREFFAQDGKDHTKPHDSNFGHYFARMLGQCVGVQNGQTWHTMRSYMDKPLASSAAAAHIGAYQQEFQSWAAQLPVDPNVGEKTDAGFCIDSVVACRRLPFKLIAMALYGDMLTESTFEKLWELNAEHEKITHTAFLEKWPQKRFYAFIPTQANRTIRKYEEDWKAVNMEIIADARKTNTECVVEKIYQGVERRDMTLTMFLQSIDEILFTNIDVTSTMFAVSLINLGRNHTVQNSLRDEIKVQVQDNISCLEYIRREDTLLHKTYLEILRLTPPAWFSLPEMTAKDKRIGGFLIPKGTSVITDLNRLNRLSSVWGDNGHEFWPKRYDTLSGTQIRYSMHGYGMGPRKCLGKNFANLILKLLVVTILKEYDLNVEGEKTNLRRDRFTCTPEQIVHFMDQKSCK